MAFRSESRRRLRPMRGTRPDPTHPLARGLIGCWTFAEGGNYAAANLLTGTVLITDVGQPTWAISRAGPGMAVDGSSAFADASLVNSTWSSPWTALALIVDYTTSNIGDPGAGAILSSRSTGDHGNGDGWNFKADQNMGAGRTGHLGLTYASVADYDSTIPSPSAVGGLYGLAVSGATATLLGAPVGGLAQVESFAVGTPYTPNLPGICFGGNHRDSNPINFVIATYVLALVYGRALAADELLALAADPWAIFRPPATRWYVSAPVGIGNYLEPRAMQEFVGLAGSTNNILTIFVRDASTADGSGLAGLTNATSGLTCYYKRDSGSAAVAVSLANISTLGAYVSGGFRAVDDTNMPGVYEFHPPDAAYAAGAKYATFMLTGATGMAPALIEVELTGVDLSASALPANITQVNGDPVGLADGTAAAVAATSITLDAASRPTTDVTGWGVRTITASTGSDQWREITAYNTTTGVATVAAWSPTPTGTVTYAIDPPASADVVQWRGETPNALATGKVDANATTSLGANAPAGWIDAASIAASALNGKGDWATAATAAAAVLAGQYEGTETLANFLKLAGAILVGNTSGGPSARNFASPVAGATTRIQSTVDGSGNRTVTSRNVS